MSFKNFLTPLSLVPPPNYFSLDPPRNCLQKTACDLGRQLIILDLIITKPFTQFWTLTSLQHCKAVLQWPQCWFYIEKQKMGQRHNYLYTSDCPHNPPGLLFTCIFVSSRLFTRLFIFSNPMSYKSGDSIWSCVCSSLLFPNIRFWMVIILYHIESQLRFKGILVRMSLAGSVNWVVNVKVLIVNHQTLLSTLRVHCTWCAWTFQAVP